MVAGKNPGLVQFSDPAYNVSEDAGSAAITVKRVGGSSGTVTVQFAAFGGTATWDVDYLNTMGTLTFNEGEIVKTFNVPVVNDAIPEGNETVGLPVQSHGRRRSGHAIVCDAYHRGPRPQSVAGHPSRGQQPRALLADLGDWLPTARHSASRKTHRPGPTGKTRWSSTVRRTPCSSRRHGRWTSSASRSPEAGDADWSASGWRAPRVRESQRLSE